MSYVCTLCVVAIQNNLNIIQISAQLQEADRVADTIATEEATSSGNDQEMQFLKQEKEFELPIPAFQISKVRPPVSMDDNTASSTSTTSFAKLKADPNMLGCQPHKTAMKENKVTTKVNLPTHKNGNSSTSDEPPKKKNVIRWFVDNHFKQDQLRMKIPENPEEW
jgi:hypothetical protein